MGGNKHSQPGTSKGKRSYVTEKEEVAEQAPLQKQKSNTDEDEEILVTFQNDSMGLKQTENKVTPLQACSKASSSKDTSNNDGSSTLINWLKEGKDQGYMQE